MAFYSFYYDKVFSHGRVKEPTRVCPNLAGQTSGVARRGLLPGARGCPLSCCEPGFPAISSTLRVRKPVHLTLAAGTDQGVDPGSDFQPGRVLETSRLVPEMSPDLRLLTSCHLQ